MIFRCKKCNREYWNDEPNDDGICRECHILRCSNVLARLNPPVGNGDTSGKEYFWLGIFIAAIVMYAIFGNINLEGFGL